MSVSVNIGRDKKSLVKNVMENSFLNSFMSFLKDSESEKCFSTSSTKSFVSKSIAEVRPIQNKELLVKLPFGVDEKFASALFEKNRNNNVPELSPISCKFLQSNLGSSITQTLLDDESIKCLSPPELRIASSNVEVHTKSTSTHGEEQWSKLGHSKKKCLQNDIFKDSLGATFNSLELKSKQSPAPVSTRRYSARLAKEKAKQRRHREIIRGKQQLSIYAKMSSSSDDELNASSAHSSENEIEDDSDKDPVWTPNISAQLKRSNSENDDRFFRRKRQQRQFVINRKTTLQVTAHADSISPIKSDTSCQIEVFALQKSDTSETSQKCLEAIDPVCKSLSFENSPHAYEKGDFVIDRRDLMDCKMFPIWKIDCGRLLQKYEPVEQNGKLFHRPLSTYSSWTDHIQLSYKAIEVSIICGTRGKELVEIVSKYQPKPPDDIGEICVKESFNVYIQIFVSQALEQNFLVALYKQPDCYYMVPLNAIDNTISKLLTRISSTISWTDEFLKNINCLPRYKVKDDVPKKFCQATDNRYCQAVKMVCLFGQVYQQDTLQVTEELNEANSQNYAVGDKTFRMFPIYHKLQHFKMNLLKQCQIKVKEKRIDIEMPENEVLDKCLSDHLWHEELQDSLLMLLKSATDILNDANK